MNTLYFDCAMGAAGDMLTAALLELHPKPEEAVAALLSMLNACASGVSVVNIDNGFGGGYMASLINHLH